MLWLHQLYAVVLDELARMNLQLLLANPYAEHHDKIGEAKLQNSYRIGQSIEHSQANQYKEIGHFPHWHGISAIAHDGENAKESDTNTHACLSLHIIEHKNHEEHDEENGYRYQHEREVEITAMTLCKIQAVYNHPTNHHADGKTHQHLPKIGRYA